MKISLEGCAATSAMVPNAPAAASTAAAALMRNVFMVKLLLLLGLMRKRPETQLLLPDGPQPGQPVRLDDQEKHDQRAEDHELDMRDGRGRQRNAERGGQLVQHERQDHDERGAEEGAENRSQAADDHHQARRERAGNG